MCGYDKTTERGKARPLKARASAPSRNRWLQGRLPLTTAATLSSALWSESHSGGENYGLKVDKGPGVMVEGSCEWKKVLLLTQAHLVKAGDGLCRIVILVLQSKRHKENLGKEEVSAR